MRDNRDRDDLEDFMAECEKNYGAQCKAAAEHAEQLLDARLERLHIKYVVSSRAKKPESLRNKLYETFAEQKNVSKSRIKCKVKDMAGARVALYFPVDSVWVEQAIYELFQNVRPKYHPEADRPARFPKRFEGYFADHYTVSLDKTNPKCVGQSWAGIRVEVQVVSLLMHAWAEVNHDLVYKPVPARLPRKDLEAEEAALLDAVNGLVVAGEVALNSLRQILQRRGIIQVPKAPDRGLFLRDEWLRGSHTILLCGPNLYSLLADTEFEEALFFALKRRNDLEVKIVIADPNSDRRELATLALRYGAPLFEEHLAKSVGILTAWNWTAEREGLKLDVRVTRSLRPETVFCRDPEEEGTIFLRRIPPGTVPAERAATWIEKAKHPRTFRVLWRTYKRLHAKGTRLSVEETRWDRPSAAERRL